MTKEKKETKEEKKKLVLSASRLKTFQQCPRKYYYNYIEKLPKKDWPHFDLGTLVHGTLEKFHEDFKKDGEDHNLKRIMKLSFKAHRKEMEEEKEISDEILLEARDLLTDYLKSMETDGIGSEIISLEKDFEIELNKDISIKGFVDRLDRDADGVYHIKDYKTNKNTRYMEPSQLRIYGIYLLDAYPDIDRFRGSYIMMRFNGSYISYDFNKEDVEKCKKELIEYGYKILEEQKFTPDQSRLCDWCDFKDTCLSTW
jgi:putative RecB family exonuclease